MQREYCSGAVLYTKVNNIINYVLVVEIDGHCGFPKGHIELGETEIQASLREIKEEIGITANILDGFLVKIEYAMKNGNIKQTQNDKRKNKTVRFKPSCLILHALRKESICLLNIFLLFSTLCVSHERATPAIKRQKRFFYTVYTKPKEIYLFSGVYFLRFLC